MSTLVNGVEALDAPVLKTQLFIGQNSNNYWIGRVESLDEEHKDLIQQETEILRGKVYSKLGYIALDQLDHRGAERDIYDEKSVHFAVIEKIQNGKEEFTRVIGTSRLIKKYSADGKLPIEKYFPEIFEAHPIYIGDVEVSRLIARHESDRTQHKVAASLIRAMTYYSYSKGIEADFCIIEKPLMKLLNSMGVPTEILGESKDIPEQGGTLLPVKIEAVKVLDSMRSIDIGKTAMQRFFLRSKVDSGEGFYDESFSR
jgi:N-acyl-L-homoserine lactone synthetase